MDKYFEKKSDVSKYSIYFKNGKSKHISISHYITFYELYVEPPKKKPKKKKRRSQKLKYNSCDYEPNKENKRREKQVKRKLQERHNVNNVHAFVPNRPNTSVHTLCLQRSMNISTRVSTTSEYK